MCDFTSINFRARVKSDSSPPLTAYVPGSMPIHEPSMYFQRSTLQVPACQLGEHGECWIATS